MSTDPVRSAAERAVTLADLHRAYNDRCIDTATAAGHFQSRKRVHEAADRCRGLTRQLEDANDALYVAEREARR